MEVVSQPSLSPTVEELDIKPLLKLEPEWEETEEELGNLALLPEMYLKSLIKIEPACEEIEDTQSSCKGVQDIIKTKACQQPTYTTIISNSAVDHKTDSEDHSNLSHQNEKTTENTEYENKESNETYKNYVDGSDFMDGVSSDDSRGDNGISESHTDSILCQCLHCQQKFERRNIQLKIKTNTNKNKFACNLCGKKYQQAQKLQVHKKTKCGTLKLFSCSVCCHGYSTNFHLQNHIASKHSNENIKREFKCSMCKEIFDTMSLLQKHQKTIHTINITQSQACDVCYKIFSSSCRVREHKRLQHSEDWFECAHCGEVCKNKQVLVCHMQRKHIPEMFKHNEGSRLHLPDKGPKKPYKYSFNRYTCEICGKCFKTKEVLKKHLLIHSGKKTFVCETCGKSFRTDTNLSQHAVIHSDKRPYICDLCKKSFRIRNHLRQHMAVHGMVSTSRKRTFTPRRISATTKKK